MEAAGDVTGYILDDLDSAPPDICPVCLRKLQEAFLPAKFDVHARFVAMRDALLHVREELGGGDAAAVFDRDLEWFEARVREGGGGGGGGGVGVGGGGVGGMGAGVEGGDEEEEEGHRDGKAATAAAAKRAPPQPVARPLLKRACSCGHESEEEGEGEELKKAKQSATSTKRATKTGHKVRTIAISRNAAAGQPMIVEIGNLGVFGHSMS